MASIQFLVTAVVDYSKNETGGSKADRDSRWQILYVKQIELRKCCSLCTYLYMFLLGLKPGYVRL